MTHAILTEKGKYQMVPYSIEEDLTSLIEKYHEKIISPKSTWIRLEKKFKTDNFKDSICDGFVLVWENPTTPLLYLTEIELERHDINRHIIPQLGDFISFIQKHTTEKLSIVQRKLYEEIQKNNSVFTKIRNETGQEVLNVIQKALEDIQVLLIMDKMPMDLSVSLSHIEKAIAIKIRKIELSRFIGPDKSEILSFTDSEDLDEDLSSKNVDAEYTKDYHIKDKIPEIQDIFNKIHSFAKKHTTVRFWKQYIGFYKPSGMIFSIVVRQKNIIIYSKEKLKEIKQGKFKSLPFRDVTKIGHYTHHLPTEIVVSEKDQIKDIISYLDHLIK